jgi:hypothetical protein
MDPDGARRAARNGDHPVKSHGSNLSRSRAPSNDKGSRAQGHGSNPDRAHA